MQQCFHMFWWCSCVLLRFVIPIQPRTMLWTLPAKTPGYRSARACRRWEMPSLKKHTTSDHLPWPSPWPLICWDTLRLKHMAIEHDPILPGWDPWSWLLISVWHKFDRVKPQEFDWGHKLGMNTAKSDNHLAMNGVTQEVPVPKVVHLVATPSTLRRVPVPLVRSTGHGAVKKVPFWILDMGKKTCPCHSMSYSRLVGPSVLVFWTKSHHLRAAWRLATCPGVDDRRWPQRTPGSYGAMATPTGRAENLNYIICQVLFLNMLLLGIEI